MSCRGVIVDDNSPPQGRASEDAFWEEDLQESPRTLKSEQGRGEEERSLSEQEDPSADCAAIRGHYGTFDDQDGSSSRSTNRGREILHVRSDGALLRKQSDATYPSEVSPARRGLVEGGGDKWDERFQKGERDFSHLYVAGGGAFIGQRIVNDSGKYSPSLSGVEQRDIGRRGESDRRLCDDENHGDSQNVGSWGGRNRSEDNFRSHEFHSKNIAVRRQSSAESAADIDENRIGDRRSAEHLDGDDSGRQMERQREQWKTPLPVGLASDISAIRRHRDLNVSHSSRLSDLEGGRSHCAEGASVQRSLRHSGGDSLHSDGLSSGRSRRYQGSLEEVGEQNGDALDELESFRDGIFRDESGVPYFTPATGRRPQQKCGSESTSFEEKGKIADPQSAVSGSLRMTASRERTEEHNLDSGWQLSTSREVESLPEHDCEKNSPRSPRELVEDNMAANGPKNGEDPSDDPCAAARLSRKSDVADGMAKALAAVSVMRGGTWTHAERPLSASSDSLLSSSSSSASASSRSSPTHSAVLLPGALGNANSLPNRSVDSPEDEALAGCRAAIVKQHRDLLRQRKKRRQADRRSEDLELELHAVRRQLDTQRRVTLDMEQENSTLAQRLHLLEEKTRVEEANTCSRLSHFVSEKSELENDVDRLSQELAETQRKLLATEKQLKEAAQESEERQAERVAAKRKRAELENNVMELRADLETCRRQAAREKEQGNVSHSIEVSDLTRELTRARQALHHCEKDLEALKEELDLAKERERLHQVELQETIDRVKQEQEGESRLLSDMELQRLRTAQSELEECKKQLDELRKVRLELAQFRAKYERAQTDCSEALALLHQRETKVRELTDALSTEEEAKDKIEADVLCMRQKHGSLSAEVSMLQERLQKAERSEVDLIADKKGVEENLQDVKSKLKTLNADCYKLQKMVKSRDKEIKRFEQSVEERVAAARTAEREEVTKAAELSAAEAAEQRMKVQISQMRAKYESKLNRMKQKLEETLSSDSHFKELLFTEMMSLHRWRLEMEDWSSQYGANRRQQPESHRKRATSTNALAEEAVAKLTATTGTLVNGDSRREKNSYVEEIDHLKAHMSEQLKQIPEKMERRFIRILDGIPPASAASHSRMGSRSRRASGILSNSDILEEYGMARGRTPSSKGETFAKFLQNSTRLPATIDFGEGPGRTATLSSRRSNSVTGGRPRTCSPSPTSQKVAHPSAAAASIPVRVGAPAVGKGISRERDRSLGVFLAGRGRQRRIPEISGTESRRSGATGGPNGSTPNSGT